MSQAERFSRVALIGLGLINSSLARVLREKTPETEIVGCARSQATLDTAMALGFVDRVTLDPTEAVAGCDLVVLGTPVGTFASLAAKIGPNLAQGAILTDVGSVKGAVISALAPHVPAGIHLVPGHPVAGTEHSGPEAGFAALFEGRWCILTPPPDADSAAVERVAALWRMAGMTVELMDVEHHDAVLAITSHLPHLIAYNIVGTVTDLMWRDIFLNNRCAVLEMLGRFTEDLSALQRAVRRGDGDYLEALFTRTRAIRRGVIEAKQV